MAVTPPLPSPLPAWSKSLVKSKDFPVVGQETVYDNVVISDTVENLVWRYAIVRYRRPVPTATTEDYAQIGFNVLKVAAGQPVTTWAAADYTAMWQHVGAFVSSFLPQTSSQYILVDFRAYVRSFNPDLPIGTKVIDPTTGLPWTPGPGLPPPNRFADSGPPANVVPSSAAGTNAGAPLPHQSAMSVTFKTAGPKHWGRVYIPGLTVGVLDTGAAGGRWLASVTTAAATAARTLIENLVAAGFYIVIPHTQQDGAFATALGTITQVQLDDIPDVIRRRRPKHAARRTALP